MKCYGVFCYPVPEPYDRIIAIVNKTINEHNGTIDFISINDGAKIQITFIKK